jgi:hypothetical protein
MGQRTAATYNGSIDMNLEKTTLWTVDIQLRGCDHTWKGVFAQEPTFYTIQRAILLEIEKITRRTENKSNDESEDDWLDMHQERSQYVLELWECIQNKPAISPAWKQVRIAGRTLGSYRTMTSEVFTQGVER